MMSTQYLYGVEPTAFMYMPYKEALEFKLVAVKKLFVELYVIDSYEEKHRVRLHHVDKAMNYTNKLLKELNEFE